jgi:hypothetical protein
MPEDAKYKLLFRVLNCRMMVDNMRLRVRDLAKLLGTTYVSIRQHTRQHTSAYVRLRVCDLAKLLGTTYVSIRQHTRQHTSAYVRFRVRDLAKLLGPAYISIRQYMSAYVSTRQHTCGSVSATSKNT